MCGSPFLKMYLYLIGLGGMSNPLEHHAFRYWSTNHSERLNGTYAARFAEWMSRVCLRRNKAEEKETIQPFNRYTSNLMW